MTSEESALARKLLAEDARRRYESGLTVVQVAVELECSYGKAYSLIGEAGGSIRPRGSKFAPPAST